MIHIIINNKLWLLTTIIILITGLYFTIKLKGIQFNINKMKTSLLTKNNNTIEINSKKTFFLSLAGRIGVGSISGIALAIYIAGPGTIFWIWIISIISAPLAYSETFLGIKYQEKDKTNPPNGGPSYYLNKGLNKKKLATIYSLIIIICYTLGFISIQSNTITISITNVIPFPKIIIAIILSIITFIIIYGGIQKIANTTSKIVPLMSIIYILLAFLITIKNIKTIPQIFILIIKNAFNFKSLITSFIPPLLVGIQRGIFSNEAGIGTCSIIASSSNNSNPQKEGYIQMFSTYITTFLICNATAIIILTTNYQTLSIKDPNGIEIATYAFKYHFGNIGNIILIISIFLFAFSTILTGYCYGEQSLKYLLKQKYNSLILKIITIIVIFFGAITSPTFIWNFTDFFIAILIIINTYALIKLRKEIKR